MRVRMPPWFEQVYFEIVFKIFNLFSGRLRRRLGQSTAHKHVHELAADRDRRQAQQVPPAVGRNQNALQCHCKAATGRGLHFIIF